MAIDIGKLKKAAGVASCFVEIGHGDMPAFSRLGKVPLADQAYLGLDIDAERWERRFSVYGLAEGRKRIDRMRKSGRPCFWSRMDENGELPLRAGSVDTVYMQMVTNDSFIGLGIALKLIDEASRVLGPGGRMAIINSPPGWRLMERGDLIIDFGPEAFGMAARSSSADATCAELRDAGELMEPRELNGNFAPVSLLRHKEFLSLHGEDPERYRPGRDFSLFSKA